MADVDRLVSAARRSVLQIVARARTQISRGLDADRAHERYVGRALSRLEDAEAYAVLAAADDSDALAAIERIIEELDALNEALSRELPNQDEAEGDR